MHRKSSVFTIAAIASALVPISSAQAQISNSGNLTAEVSSLRNEIGQVCFSLFDSAGGFPNNPEAIVETKCISLDAETSVETEVEAETNAAAQSGTAERGSTASGSTESGSAQSGSAAKTDAEAPLSVTFESLPLGTYAVSVFHDENGDGKINRGGFGIPLEGFGFSRNPSITTSAPDFEETAVIVVGPNTTTEIELIYY